MLHQLIESGAGPQRRRSWTLASTLIHASLIGSAIVLTARAPMAFESARHRTETLFFTPRSIVPTPARPSGSPSRIASPTGELPILLIRIPTISGVEILAANVATHLSALTEGIETPSGHHDGTPAGGVLAVTQVDRAVLPLANLRPDYPPALRAAGIDGEVLVRFVVDSSGRVEVGSIEVLRTTHPQFGQSVQHWLTRMHYQPAQVAGAPVRQLVEQRVAFSLRPRY